MSPTHRPAARRFHVQDADGRYPQLAFHDSVSALWSQRWRAACAAGRYPFGEADVADFDPIFARLIEASGDDPAILNRPDEYAQPFLDAGDRLSAQADLADVGNDSVETGRLLLRAAAVYRMGRFPAIRSSRTREAWRKQVAAYERGGRYLDPPAVAVDLPFTRVDTALGDTDSPIPAIVRDPDGPPPTDGRPVLILLCGLDGYRNDQTDVTNGHLAQGIATVTVEIPGTGDCPAAPGDPASSDRIVDSVIDWISTQAQGRGWRRDRILLHGLSTGGYHAVRAAHQQHDRLFAVIAQGGGSHLMFDPDWIDHQNTMEFPFALVEALAWKFGYRDSDVAASVAAYRNEASRFSLLDSGVLASPCARLLVINGMEDSIFPVEDSILMATETTNVHLAIAGNRDHMGEPDASAIITDWLDRTLSSSTRTQSS